MYVHENFRVCRGIKGFYLKAGRGAWGLVGDTGGRVMVGGHPALVLGNTFSDSVV